MTASRTRPSVVAAEDERVRLVLPAYAQSVESSGALDLGLMGEIASRTVRLGTSSDDARRAAGVIQFPRWITAEGNGMLRTLLVSLVALLALPASALAADSAGDRHKDRTTEIMLGIIFVLMLGMVLIGVLEGRASTESPSPPAFAGRTS